VRVTSRNGQVSEDVPILFVGLAPGMTGVYLLSVHLPETLTLPAPALGQSPPFVTSVFLQLTEEGTSDQGFVFFPVAAQ
jgi:hypothetical protein